MPFPIAPCFSTRGRPALSLCAVLLASAAWSNVAKAEDLKPILPQDRLCPGLPEASDPPTEASETPVAVPVPSPQLVSRQAIIAVLFSENLVRDSTLDANGDGNTLIDEKIRALTGDDYCASVAAGCNDADKAALAKAREQLQAFADAGGGPGYRLEALDGTGTPLPEAVASTQAGDLLRGLGQSVQIRCVALPKASPEEEPADQSYWHDNGKAEHGFRLAGDIDNLSKSRTSLGAVKAAELSITSDLIEDETAYRVNAIAGYEFSLAGGEDDVETSIIPFLQAERVTSGSETQIDTLGAGFQQAATVNWPGSLRSEFAVTPVYQTDSQFDAATGTLKFRWTPTFIEGSSFPLGFPQVYGPVELRLGLDLLADAGRVFVEGDGNNLDGEGNFIRLGSQGALRLRGAPGNLFRQFELQLSDRYLYNVDTQFEHINQFDAALAYLFPGNEHYQLSFAYSNGRDDVSLELYEFWQTQFGIRF